MLMGSLEVRQPTEDHEVAGMGPTANTEDAEDEVETAWTPRAFLGPKPNGTPLHLGTAPHQYCTPSRLAPASRVRIRIGRGRSKDPLILSVKFQYLNDSITIYH